MKTRFRLTVGPVGTDLATALARELTAQGVEVSGGWHALADQGGWQLEGSRGQRMSLVVTAIDSAAVHRAVARVGSLVDVAIEANVSSLD